MALMVVQGLSRSGGEGDGPSHRISGRFPSHLFARVKLGSRLLVNEGEDEAVMSGPFYSSIHGEKC